VTLAILIPTVHRADKLQGILDNAHEVTTVAHQVYFIAESSDEPTKRALKDLAGDHVAVFGEFGSCARAMNAGFQASTEPFVFTGNDDLWFHPGWETAAINQLEQTGLAACGTNDGNGRMTCFAMVRRSYIESNSGVFDQPETLYHDYQSQYVDTEFADYMKARGQWTEATESLTEHLHWEFGKADGGHQNYQKARETCSADEAIYRARRPLWQQAAKETST
jgi:hypothetical protein